MITQFCILIHYHEISLKGKNRSWFERRLISNIKRQLTGLPVLKTQLNAARIFCFGIDESQWVEYARRLKKVMGIKHAILVNQLECDIKQIQKSASNQLHGVAFNSFRVTTKRQYKEFPLSSQEVNEEVGKHIQSLYLKSVDLKNAELDMTASVTNTYNRENLFYFNRIKYERVNQLPIMPSFGISLSF